eukprot:SAG11_NODE_1696_length_4435_cov_3.645295_2_plen_208_part_00
MSGATAPCACSFELGPMGLKVEEALRSAEGRRRLQPVLELLARRGGGGLLLDEDALNHSRSTQSVGDAYALNAVSCTVRLWPNNLTIDENGPGMRLLCVDVRHTARRAIRRNARSTNRGVAARGGSRVGAGEAGVEAGRSSSIHFRWTSASTCSRVNISPSGLRKSARSRRSWLTELRAVSPSPLRDRTIRFGGSGRQSLRASHDRS